MNGLSLEKNPIIVAESEKAKSLLESIKSLQTESTESSVLSDLRSNINETLKRMKNLKDFFIKPKEEQMKKEKAFFALFSSPVEEAKDLLDVKLKEHHRKKEEERVAEQARLRLLQEAETKRQAEAQQASETPTQSQLGETLIEEELALKPQCPIHSAMIPEVEKSVEGKNSKMNYIDHWVFKEVDFGKVPEKYKKQVLDKDAIQADIDKGIRQIEGLEILNDVIIRSRS